MQHWDEHGLWEMAPTLWFNQSSTQLRRRIPQEGFSAVRFPFLVFRHLPSLKCMSEPPTVGKILAKNLPKQPTWQGCPTHTTLEGHGAEPPANISGAAGLLPAWHVQFQSAWEMFPYGAKYLGTRTTIYR